MHAVLEEVNSGPHPAALIASLILPLRSFPLLFLKLCYHAFARTNAGGCFPLAFPRHICYNVVEVLCSGWLFLSTRRPLPLFELLV